MRHKHTHTPQGHHRHRGRRHGRRGGGRLFDYGELRVLVLAMIDEAPSHGYEIMKAIEERVGGGYSPSPGVIYPTLAWLDDMGYAAVETAGGKRKQYSITEEGRAFLAANREAADALVARAAEAGSKSSRPAPVVRAMENLKTALRLRLENGPLEPAAVEAVADALDAAAKTIEKS